MRRNWVTIYLSVGATFGFILARPLWITALTRISRTTVAGTEEDPPTGQAAGAGRCRASTQTDNAPCRRIFPARRVAFWRAPDRRRGFCQGGKPWLQAATCPDASPKRDADDGGVRNPG